MGLLEPYIDLPFDRLPWPVAPNEGIVSTEPCDHALHELTSDRCSLLNAVMHNDEKSRFAVRSVSILFATKSSNTIEGFSFLFMLIWE